jgi:hypothetical protein
MATGLTVSSSYFGLYVAKFFTKNDAGTSLAGRLAALDAEQDRIFFISVGSGAMSPAKWSGTTRYAFA